MPQTLSRIFFLIMIIWAGSVGAAILQEQPCGVETCHGLEITCGPRVPKMCTDMYKLGDFCREYVRCEVVEGKCQLIQDDRFPACKACVEACSVSTGPDAFKCEAACREAAEGDRIPRI